MRKLTINHPAVWLGVVLLSILGFMWYGPLFGETWMGMEGLNPTEVEANPPGAGVWITNFIATIIPMYALAWFFTKIPVDSALQGLGIGLLIGFAFAFLSRMTNDMFAQNPYGLSWIVGGFNMLSLGLGGLILGAWRKYEDGGKAVPS